MLRDTIDKINFELDEIERLISSYSILTDLLKNKEPDLIELSAVASFLHSFYTGIEKVFTIIAKEIDANLPQGHNWHRDILQLMNAPNNKRPIVINDNTFSSLEGYLAFRHYFRHAYSFQLNWDKSKDLFFSVYNVWENFYINMKIFIKIINEQQK